MDYTRESLEGMFADIMQQSDRLQERYKEDSSQFLEAFEESVYKAGEMYEHGMYPTTFAGKVGNLALSIATGALFVLAAAEGIFLGTSALTEYLISDESDKESETTEVTDTQSDEPLHPFVGHLMSFAEHYAELYTASQSDPEGFEGAVENLVDETIEAILATPEDS